MTILITAGLLAGGSYFRIFEYFELSALDLRFRVRPALAVSDSIVHIDIADDTITKLGQFPLDRSYHAVLVKALAEAGAKAIIFDIFFSEQSPKDEELEQAVNAAGNVYFPNVLSVDTSKKYKIPEADGFVAETLEQFILPARGVGHINIMPDSDGKFRRVPLLIKHQGKYYPYLSFQVVLDELNIPFRSVQIKEGHSITLGLDVRIPLDEQSNMIINFSGPWGKSYRHYSYVDVLKSYVAQISGDKPLLDLNVFKDKLCIIGLTAAGTSDLHPSPFEPLYPAVGIHAEVINAVLHRSFITRVSREINVLILLCLLLLLSWASLKTKPWKAFYILLGEVIFFVLLSVLLFDFWALWIDVFYPIVAMVLVYAGCTLFEYVVQWKKNVVMENELQIAKKIQESFLPKKNPEFSGLDTAAAMYTARHVGGDLYDFLPFDNTKLGVMIGDVTGKGVPASLLMAMTVSAFRFFAQAGIKPEESLSKLNDKIRLESTSKLFVTVYYAIFDTGKKLMLYASAGHNPTLYLPKEGAPQFLDVKEGPPAGMLKAKFSGKEIAFATGDVFIFYTDGVTEAKNAQGEMYTEKRLVKVTEGLKNLSAQHILEALIKDVFTFEPRSRQHDDVTVMVIKVVE